ncbi:Beta-lactamase class C [Sulfitobacter noctilucicola]|uniref:CubicO group peptidase (Beta-lactamase class C family) n=1 Tax=Sulfitobacter noctilucicola TaxID=1342301 RepID=A0A7W6MBN8_9RHOB|nr:serine hydrolase domain-containing protein [Sulfitobacter noctilucicola]KIN70206.1 Beta-lactamase class C [Sulfitobacter noctilucicola]MBB4176111.1 CubicO group peptidase (beta-lactamase class C family) [Sulfitobacter noctilucicola]
MSSFDTSRLDRIKGWMQGYVDARRYPGCSVLVAQGGNEVFYHDCGLRDVAGGLPWQRDTVARIYSMTKPITSVALMILVERGLVHLDAPVSDFIPGFADARCLVPDASDLSQTEPCAAPTLHQLLTHTSGVSYSFNPGVVSTAMREGKMDFGPGQLTLAQMSDKLAELPLAFRPGTRWEYSVGIDLIGRVIEVISGKPFGTFLQDEIFDPLGMDETRFILPEGLKDRFASLYTPLAGDSFDLNAKDKSEETLRQTDGVEGSPYLDTKMQSGGGGLVGTIDDYARFTDMLRAGGKGILSPHTLSFMMRNHLPGDIASMGPASFAEQPMDGMGFGIGGAVVLDPGRVRVPGSVGDFSWGGMASTFFWVDPVQDLSVIFFTQLAPSSSYPSRSQLKALIHGALT